VHLVKRPKCEKRLPVFYRQASMTEYLEKTAPAADEESLSMLSDAADSYHSGASVTGAAYKLMSELYQTGRRFSHFGRLTRCTGFDFSIPLETSHLHRLLRTDRC